MASLANQPKNINYLTNVQFKFELVDYPGVTFFVQGVNLPGLSTQAAQMPFPRQPGIQKNLGVIEFEMLSINFLVDEYLENYISLHNWMVGIGFPEKREQFRTFRDVTSNTPAGGGTPSVDIIGSTTPDRALYSDAFLQILSNKNNPIVEVIFKNVFPTSLSALDFTQTATDVENLVATAEFAYQIYEIKTL